MENSKVDIRRVLNLKKKGFKVEKPKWPVEQMGPKLHLKALDMQQSVPVAAAEAAAEDGYHCGP